MPNILFRTLRLTLYRLAAIIFLSAILVVSVADGGENLSDFSSSTQEEAYRKAMREAEKELAEPAIDAKSENWSLSAFLSIAALAIAIGLTIWLVRRLQRRGWTTGIGREMRVLDRLPLGRQSTLFLVQLKNRQYWLAEHARGITLLGEYSADDKSDRAPLEKENIQDLHKDAHASAETVPEVGKPPRSLPNS